MGREEEASCDMRGGRFMGRAAEPPGWSRNVVLSSSMSGSSLVPAPDYFPSDEQGSPWVGWVGTHILRPHLSCALTHNYKLFHCLSNPEKGMPRTSRSIS